MSPKPLMLKDYLELDSCSESFWWAPLQRTGGTTVRSLLETEFGCGAADKGGWRLLRSRSKGAFIGLSAVIKFLHFSNDDAPVASAEAGAGGGSPSILPRSFSKKLRRSFWKKCSYEKEEQNFMVKDNVLLRSFDEEAVERVSLLYPSPVESRCSSSSDFLSSACSDLFEEGKELMPISPRTERGVFDCAGEETYRTPTGSQQPEDNCGKVDMVCPFEKEKEQLSPVSVMDFPYQEEDEDEAVVEQPSANLPCFEQSIINIERTKNQLLQKIRRFERLANLYPVELDHRFVCTKPHAETIVHVETDEEEEDHENQARRQCSASALLHRLTDKDSLPTHGEKLLLDFFCEGLSYPEDCWRWTKSECYGNEELLMLARSWVVGGGIAAEHDREVAVVELERCGGGWKRFQEEELIVAVEMTGGVVTWLMEELVDDLLVSVA